LERSLAAAELRAVSLILTGPDLFLAILSNEVAWSPSPSLDEKHFLWPQKTTGAVKLTRLIGAVVVLLWIVV